MDVKTVICGGFIIIISLLILNRKKISRYLDKEVEEINAPDQTNDEIEHFVLLYGSYDSRDLIEMIRLNDDDTNQTRAIRKVLRGRNIPFVDITNL